MSGIQWNLLNTNAPAEIGQGIVNNFQQGVQGGQKMYMNQLAMGQARRQEQQQMEMQQALMQSGGDLNKVIPQVMMRDPKLGMELQKSQSGMRTSELEQEIKLQTIRQNAANTIATAPEGMVLQTAFDTLERTSQLAGASPEQKAAAQQHLQMIFDTKGEEGLRKEAGLQTLQAKDRLSKIQMVDAGDRVIPTEMNPNAPGFSQQPIQKGMAPGKQQELNLREAAIKAKQDMAGASEEELDSLTQEEIDVFGEQYNLTGKLPSLGYGKAAAKVRIQIAKSAANLALGNDTNSDKTPLDAALDNLGKQSDTKAIQGTMNFLEKQLGAMGSFVSNIELQVDKVKELSKEMETFDTRLLNMPLRAVRGRLAGSAMQAKYDMYLTEIEGEIGKLATGSSASIAELSVSAQEKWAKIHDKNLSLKDMVSLLEETKNAARMRLQSVDKQMGVTRSKLVNRTETGATQSEQVGDTVIEPAPLNATPGQQGGFVVEPQPLQTPQQGQPMAIKSDAEYDALPSGSVFIAPDGSKRRKP